MSQSRRTIVPTERTETVEGLPNDSQEPEEKSADPLGVCRRTEFDRSRKKEGHQDRQAPRSEKGPVGTNVRFPEMFFG